MSYSDKTLTELIIGADKAPTNLDDRIISNLAQEVLSTRGGIRRVMDMSDDISIEARDALEELLK